MSPKAHQQLRDGRLITPTMDSMCGGLNLKVGKLYLIAGNGANIGICNYVKEYSQMTIVERRGFAGGYKKGCPCEVISNIIAVSFFFFFFFSFLFSILSQQIKTMFRREGFHQAIGTCSWSPFAKCESDYGACIPARGLMTADHKPIKCHWRNSPPYAACRNETILQNGRQQTIKWTIPIAHTHAHNFSINA